MLNENKKTNHYCSGNFLISIIALAGTTFAVFTASLTGTKKVSIQTGTLDIVFNEGNRINLTNAAPVTDAKGQELLIHSQLKIQVI